MDVKIYSIVPGLYIQGLVVEIESLHGAAAKPTSGGSTTYRATVKDNTGLCTLIYRQGPQCNPASIRKGNTYAVTGQVIWEHGHIIIDATAVSKTHERVTFSNVTDPSCLFNFSQPQHLQALLLLRHNVQRQWEVLLSHTTTTTIGSSSSSKDITLTAATVSHHGSSAADHKPQVHILPKSLAPVPLGFVSGALSDPAAAARILDHVLQLQNHGDYQLLPLPAAAFVWGSGAADSSSSRVIVHLHAAVLQQHTAAGVSRDLGRWLPVQDILQQQQQQSLLPHDWSAVMHLLLGNSLAFLSSHSSSSSSSNTVSAVDRSNNNTATTATTNATTAATAASSESDGPQSNRLDELSNAESQQQQQTGKIPVTLISGLPGSGKTTLVKHILQDASNGLRIAAVVDDVAALSSDPTWHKGGLVTEGAQEGLLDLQNGCICCSVKSTSQVKAIAELAAAGGLDVMLLEANGFSEPSQMAEVFALDPADDADEAADDTAAAAAILRGVAYLDTAVTVVDAQQLMNNLHSIRTIKSELAAQAVSNGSSATTAAVAAAGSDVLSGHRHIVEILLGQIEVASVLVLNKADAVAEQQLQLMQAILTALNPTAKLITTSHSVLNPKEGLQTGLWTADKDQGLPAWVQLLRSDSANIGQARSEQQQQQQQVGGSSAAYGVSRFVYRARWPFHPKRLHDFMTKFFVLQEPDWNALMSHHDHDHCGHDCHHDCDHSDHHDHDHTLDNSSSGVASSSSSSSSSRSDDYEQIAADLATVKEEDAAGGGGSSSKSSDQLQTAAAARRQAFEGRYGMLLRSKGFVWLATRGDHIGEWSQAGSSISFSTGGPWFRVLPTDLWPDDDQERSQIRSDFVPPFGDRRQELVFIGVNLNESDLRSSLDECLVTINEAESSGFSNLEDPFEPWPDVNDMIDTGEASEDDEEIDEQQQQQEMQVGGLAAAAAESDKEGQDALRTTAAGSSNAIWQPEKVTFITDGAAQLQQLFDILHNQCNSSSSGNAPPAAAVVHWLAPWADASQAAEAQLATLAATFPHLPVISVNVTVSDTNRQLAFEKVMQIAQCYRKGGRQFQPVPKSGHKWPCVTLHNLPLLQPLQEFSGAEAGQQLMEVLQGQGLLLKQQQQQQQQGCNATGSSSAGQRQQQPRAAAATSDSSKQQQQQQQGVHQLIKGATDLKLLLQKIQPTDLLLLLWTDSSSSSSVGFPNTLITLMQQYADNSSSSSSTGMLSGRQIVLATANAAATAANKALAAALKVTVTPTVQIYHDRQVIKAVKLNGCDADAAAAKVQAAVLQLQLLPLPQQQQEAAPDAVTAASSSSNATATLNSSSIWDPPTGKSAKPGSKHRLPASAVYTAASSSSSKKSTSKSRSAAAAAATVAAVYWPRMPCLNCGCPWWLGEDWDAACARCGWTCENDGYDDDSNVLPEYINRYKMICDMLKQGRTPGDLEPLDSSWQLQ